MSAKKIAYIDSLRGVAILMVVATHVGAEITSGILSGVAAYGRMGVQLFFVMSALTLCMSLENRLAEYRWISKYLVRRYFRIAPVYYIGAALYLSIDLLDGKAGAELRDFVLHFLFLHAFFPESFSKVVPGGWSIGVEFAFYFFFPFLYIKFCRASAGRSVVLLVFSVLLSSLNNYYLFSVKNSEISLWSYPYWSFLNNFPVFSVGLVLYVMKTNTLVDRIGRAGSLVGFGIFTLLAMFAWKVVGGRFAVSAVPVLSAVSFAFLYCLFRSVEGLNHSWLQRVGQVSFSVYIFHFAIISFFVTVFRSWLDRIPGDFCFLLLYLSVIGSVFCVASLSEKYLEKPFVRFAAKITSGDAGFFVAKGSG